MSEKINPLLLDAMKLSGFVKEDGKPKIKEFSEYIGVAQKTVIGWKTTVSGVGEFGLRMLIENEKMKAEVLKSRNFRKGLKDYLEEDN